MRGCGLASMQRAPLCLQFGDLGVSAFGVQVVTMDDFMHHLAPSYWPPEERTLYCLYTHLECKLPLGNPTNTYWGNFDIEFRYLCPPQMTPRHVVCIRQTIGDRGFLKRRYSVPFFFFMASRVPSGWRLAAVTPSRNIVQGEVFLPLGKGKGVPDPESSVGALRTHMAGGHCGDGIHHQYALILQRARPSTSCVWGGVFTNAACVFVVVLISLTKCVFVCARACVRVWRPHFFAHLSPVSQASQAGVRGR